MIDDWLVGLIDEWMGGWGEQMCEDLQYPRLLPFMADQINNLTIIKGYVYHQLYKLKEDI